MAEIKRFGKLNEGLNTKSDIANQFIEYVTGFNRQQFDVFQEMDIKKADNLFTNARSNGIY